jgi:polyisoprenoid-binding protein YceI
VGAFGRVARLYALYGAHMSAPTLAVAGTWEIDSRHSTMRFSVMHHAVAWFRAGFRPIAGSYDAEQHPDGSVALELIEAH